MTTQLVLASTLFAAAGAAAAVDSGMLGSPDERVLIVSNAAPVPELTPALDQIPAAAPALARFDRVVRLADVLGAAHPHMWSPRESDAPVLERLLRHAWGLGDGPVELVLESPTVDPAKWLARVFRGSPVSVHSDGLMAYGPWRHRPALHLRQRLDALVHLDLVPGLTPVATRELGFAARPVPTAAFRAVLEELAEVARPRWWPADGTPTAVVVGQYLAALDLLTVDEEADLHARMVRAAVAAGMRRVVLRPHPSAPPGRIAPVARAAAESGVELLVVGDPLPVEVAMAAQAPDLLVGCFSTAIATSRAVLGIQTLAVGTDTVLARLVPAENSNRVPAAIVHATARGASGAELQRVVDAVAFSMQPERLAHWRTTAVAVLEPLGDAERRVLVPVERLTELRLPGSTGRLPRTLRRRLRRGIGRRASAVLARMGLQRVRAADGW